MSQSFEDLLQRWAVWVESGMQSYRQQVAPFLRTPSSRGQGGSAPLIGDDSVEHRIEMAVSAIARQNPRQAVVIRAEYSAKNGQKTQLDVALSLNLTLRTYQRALQAAKEFIKKEIQWS